MSGVRGRDANTLNKHDGERRSVGMVGALSALRAFSFEPTQKFLPTVLT